MAKYIRPDLDTKFHVDFSWWAQKRQNLRVFLQGHLCQSCQELAKEHEGETFDWIDPETGEVHRIEMLWHLIHANCQDDPEFFDARVPLTTAIFRAFIVNNNTPLTPIEIHEKIQKKSPEMILRTIGRRRVYQGIKPVVSSV